MISLVSDYMKQIGWCKVHCCKFIVIINWIHSIWWIHPCGWYLFSYYLSPLQ